MRAAMLTNTHFGSVRLCLGLLALKGPAQVRAFDVSTLGLLLVPLRCVLLQKRTTKLPGPSSQRMATSRCWRMLPTPSRLPMARPSGTGQVRTSVHGWDVLFRFPISGTWRLHAPEQLSSGQDDQSPSGPAQLRLTVGFTLLAFQLLVWTAVSCMPAKAEGGPCHTSMTSLRPTLQPRLAAELATQKEEHFQPAQVTLV